MMGSAPVLRSPLESLAADIATSGGDGARGVRLREVPFLAQVNLRADPDDAVLMARIGRALGFDLPTQPNTTVAGGDRSALWLGPNEWLVIGPAGTQGDLERLLRDALGEAFGSVVDLSANRTTLELRGPLAREVLMKGCAIDLHPRSFGTGRCAQTVLARAAVILEQASDEPTYRILVRGSFAIYLARWLIDAMAEYGEGGPS